VREVTQARLGPGRLLVAVYAVFAVSATARSTVQIATRFGDAPVAYLLSALAAVVYVVATVALARGALLVALIACGVELVGVVVVGAASLLMPEAFPDATVWSVFGSGYGFVPLVLPVVGLWWVLHVRRAQRAVRSE
jgi:cytochrome bd-type quinol oxidase subunit 2